MAFPNPVINRDKINSHSYEKSQKSYKGNPVVFTIGYEGKSIDEYIKILVHNQIKILIDTRYNPISRIPFFSKTKLSNALGKSGVEYVHIKELGIPSTLRRGLKKGQHAHLFKAYQNNIAEKSPYLERICNLLMSNGNVAITCFEREYHFCHRSIIADELNKKFGLKIMHV